MVGIRRAGIGPKCLEAMEAGPVVQVTGIQGRAIGSRRVFLELLTAGSQGTLHSRSTSPALVVGAGIASVRRERRASRATAEVVEATRAEVVTAVVVVIGAEDFPNMDSSKQELASEAAPVFL